MQKKTISFDFDKTLTRKDVQEIARYLVRKGHNVIVTTARWCSPLIHLWHQNPTNYDMYSVLDAVGIDRQNVIFTNTNTKAHILRDACVDLHIDDNDDQIFWCNQLGVKNVHVSDTMNPTWASEIQKYVSEPKHGIKLLICGEGRHGKDTAAEILNDYLGLKFESSSWCVAKLFYDKHKGDLGYTSIEECYNDRVNHRDKWYNFICEYNKGDRTRLTREILSKSNIYVGLRDDNEFTEAKHLFDLTIYIDASKRLPPEPSSSNKIKPEMCDVLIDNSSDLETFRLKIQKLADVLKLK